MNITFLLIASSGALNPCCLLLCISAVTWQEIWTPIPKHCKCCPQPWLPLDSAWAALVGCQVGLYPSYSKIIPAEGCAKPLKGIESPRIISDLLLFRIFPLRWAALDGKTFDALGGLIYSWFLQTYQAHASVLISSLGELVREESTVFFAIPEILSAFWQFYKDVFCKG